LAAGRDGDANVKGEGIMRGLPIALLAVVHLLVLAALVPAAGAREPAVVALGDSAISGESAGNYEPGTNQPGNYCHRSLDALIHETAIPRVTTKLNLACSGASSHNLYIGGSGQYGEPPQSQKLAQVAERYRVRLVIVEVGANDDPAFGRVATSCVTAYVFQTAGCRYTEGVTWADRVAAAMPKVGRALDDVRTVMRAAGYADSSWQAVLASYWSPVPRPPIRYSGYFSKLWNGCPLYNADMEWGHDVAVPILSQALGALAGSKGWRFLDFSRSMNGREVCAEGITHSQEWTTGTKYDPSSSYWYSFDAVRQSLHVNARGHAQLGRCLTEFAALAGASAACVRGADGNLHAVR
jgi:lysophospholipase L1-like esterase